MPSMAFSFDKKKMSMIIYKYEYYRKKIQYYLVKIWDRENKPKPESKYPKKLKTKLYLQYEIIKNSIEIEETGSILSAKSTNNNNSVEKVNQTNSQSASDEKSSFLQSEELDDPTISSFKKLIVVLIIPFSCLIIIDYVLFSIDVNLILNFRINIKITSYIMKIILYVQQS